MLHEYNPLCTDVLSDEEAQSRGSVDQLPLIIDAEQPISYSSPEGHTESFNPEKRSLKSKSSSDSLGPYTPRDGSLDNADRRYVYIPKEGIEIPLTYDEPRIPPPIAQRDHESKDKDSLRRRKEKPVLDTSTLKKQGVDEKEVPLTTRREPSPYSYVANSGKSTFSGDYLLSPDNVTPKTPFVNSPRSAGNLNSHVSDGLKPRGIQDRAFSNSSTSRVERPNFDRHVSAMAYSEEHTASSSSQSSQRRYYSSSDESDSASDDSRRRSRRNRGRQQSFVRSSRPTQTPAPWGGASLKSEKRTSASFQRPASPISQPATNPAFGKTFPPRLPASHESTTPTRSFTVDGASSNKPPVLPRRPTLSQTSPLPSPLPDNKRDSEYAGAGPRSRPNSRPVSPISHPLHHPHSAGLAPPNNSSSETRYPSNTPRSRQASPLPSPNLEHTFNLSSSAFNNQALPTNRAHKASTNPPDLPLRPGSRNPSAPYPVPVPSSTRPVVFDNARRTVSSMDSQSPMRINTHSMRRVSDFPTSPQLNSSASRPPTALPSRSVRKPLVLPPCPRPDYTRGYNDWHTLVGSDDFDICPTCFEAVIDAGYRHHFKTAPTRPYGYETRCDFGAAWVRMAWLLTLKENLPHVNLLYTLTNIITHEPRCPGKKGAVRTWYRLYDPETNREVSNFDICPACVASVECIFPALRGVFIPTLMANPSQKRICDLQSDSSRFAKYTDLLEEISNQAMQYRRPPNMYRFVLLARQMASLRECTRDDMVIGQAWHIIPHLPEFSVCEECFEHAVRPHINEGSPIAGQFNRSLQLLSPVPEGEGVSCQLYSRRMREMFGDMCRRNDFQGLRAAVMQRWRVERDLQRKVRDLRSGGGDIGEEMEMLVEEWMRWEYSVGGT